MILSTSKNSQISKTSCENNSAASKRRVDFQIEKEDTTASRRTRTLLQILIASKDEANGKCDQQRIEQDCTSVTSTCSSSISSRETLCHDLGKNDDQDGRILSDAEISHHRLEQTDLLIPIQDTPSRILPVSTERSKRELLLDNTGEFEDMLNQVFCCEYDYDGCDAEEDENEFVLY